MRGLMMTNLMPLMRTRAGVFTPVAVMLMVRSGTPVPSGTRGTPGTPGSLTL
jgi:hypothetical protein